MSVVRRSTCRRWLVVGLAVAVLCALPALAGALPVSAPHLDAAQIESRILASADSSYQGYAQSTGTLTLPDFPQLGNVSSLLGGDTTMRAWFVDQQHWRVDVVDLADEQDLYQTPQGTMEWDFGNDLVTDVLGNPPLHLPRAADLVPPALARRLLDGLAPTDSLTALPAQRVAGVGAVGLRIVPSDPSTTVGSVDIWADPANGIPLEVVVSGRAQAAPVLVTRFLDVSFSRPAASVVTLTPAAGVPVTTVRSDDVAAALGSLGGRPLPAELAGHARSPTVNLQGIAGYGTGFSTFVVTQLPGQVGDQAMAAATRIASARLSLPGGTGVVARSSILTVLVAQIGPRHRTYLLAGFTTPALLQSAAFELSARRGPPG